MSAYTADEAAARAGIDPALATRLWVALGFAASEPGERAYDDEDIEALRYAAEVLGSGMADEDLVVQITRTMASSVARIADAQVEILMERMQRTGAEELGRFGERTPWLLGYMWRRHANAAMRRALELGTDETSLAVGFADLVGFTALSQELEESELAEVVSAFETLAHENVVRRGGRVVKMIGDEVMFAVADVRSGVEIALSLADAYSESDLLQDVRVGLSCGGVLHRQGDLYGPPVNLASRIVGIARPGSVVVSEAVYDLLAEEPAYEWRSLRPRTFKGIGRVPIWRVRRAGG